MDGASRGGKTTLTEGAQYAVRRGAVLETAPPSFDGPP